MHEEEVVAMLQMASLGVGLIAAVIVIFDFATKKRGDKFA